MFRFKRFWFCRARLVAALKKLNQLNCRGFCCLGQDRVGGAQLVVGGAAEATRCSKCAHCENDVLEYVGTKSDEFTLYFGVF